jgi:acid phosphatase
MRSVASVALFAGAALGAVQEPASFATTRPPMSTIEPTQASIAASAATVVPGSSTSNVKGAAFSRIIQIWLENTDYNASFADPNMQFLAVSLKNMNRQLFEEVQG